MMANDPRKVDLADRLAHHDAAIESLSGRIKGVETGMAALATDVNRGFAEIGSKLSKLEGARGPGFGQIITVIACGGAVVGMSAGAITILVTSFVSPDITKLKTEALRTERAIDLREQQERQELTDLRRAQAQSLADDIRTLGRSVRAIESRFGWSAGTNVKPQ